MLPDSYGRIATDLRVSLTDKCNLRCAYCMPPEGLDWLPSPDLLTDTEVVRLVRVAVERLGVREVRFTGGEPLLRRGLAGVVAQTPDPHPRPGIPPPPNASGGGAWGAGRGWRPGGSPAPPGAGRPPPPPAPGASGDRPPPRHSWSTEGRP